jgi:S1-C subfamily serine protease
MPRPDGPCGARPLLAAVVTAVALLAVGCIDDPAATGAGSLTSGRRPPVSSDISTPGPLSDAELLSSVRGSITRVRSVRCDGTGVGTGWMLEPGRVITNRHVVEDSTALELLTWDGRDVPVVGGGMSGRSDLAAVDVAGDGLLRPLTRREEPVAPGERIGIIGYPGGGPLTVSTGVAVDYVPGEQGTAERWLRATTVIHPGNSGGPAVDMQGRVVGVVFAEYVRDDHALVIPIDEVVRLGAEPLEAVSSAC